MDGSISANLPNEMTTMQLVDRDKPPSSGDESVLLQRVLSASNHGMLEEIVQECQYLEILPTSLSNATNQDASEYRQKIMIAQMYALLLQGDYHESRLLFQRSGINFPKEMIELARVSEHLLHHDVKSAISVLSDFDCAANNVGALLVQRLRNAIRIRTLHDILTIYKSVEQRFVEEHLGFTTGTRHFETYLKSNGIPWSLIWKEKDGDFIMPSPCAAAKLLLAARNAPLESDLSLLQLVDHRHQSPDKLVDDTRGELHQLLNIITFVEQSRTNV